ncbi:MAG: putative porin [Novosphingobium sp.]|nr:putative porin [Novosphingobium sp.]MCP5401860.1 putative porin [Novosphingobium sp.]
MQALVRGVRRRLRPDLLATLSLLVAMAWATPAFSRSDGERIRALEAQVEAQAARIAELERKLDMMTSAVATAPQEASPDPEIAERGQHADPAEGTAPATGPAPRAARFSGVPGLDLTGDLRLRQEFNWSDAEARDRSRSVVRARLAARYALADTITLGARLVTGDPDDPNSADVTLSDFADDLQVSLDQLFAQARLGPVTLVAGKFPQIMRRTDLVWDGDVNPQGLGATLSLPVGHGWAFDARGLYFVIDESVGGEGSALRGVQLGLSGRLANDWSAQVSGSYYDYKLSSVAGADAGDFRGNLVGLDGRYLSDFDLVEALGSLTYSGAGKRWPLKATFDLVHNRSAATSRDTAYSIGLSAGRAARPGDWRFEYAYLWAQTDAVFAAFSHDNLPLSTDYELHSLSIDHAVLPRTVLNATFYHFRSLRPGPLPSDWRNRLRLNLLFTM